MRGGGVGGGLRRRHNPLDEFIHPHPAAQPIQVNIPGHQLGQRALDFDKTRWVRIARRLRIAAFHNRHHRIHRRLLKPRLTAAFQHRQNLEMLQEKALQSVPVAHIQPGVRGDNPHPPARFQESRRVPEHRNIQVGKRRNHRLGFGQEGAHIQPLLAHRAMLAFVALGFKRKPIRVRPEPLLRQAARHLGRIALLTLLQPVGADIREVAHNRIKLGDGDHQAGFCPFGRCRG